MKVVITLSYIEGIMISYNQICKSPILFFFPFYISNSAGFFALFGIWRLPLYLLQGCSNFSCSVVICTLLSLCRSTYMTVSCMLQKPFAYFLPSCTSSCSCQFDILMHFPLFFLISSSRLFFVTNLQKYQVLFIMCKSLSIFQYFFPPIVLFIHPAILLTSSTSFLTCLPCL